MTRLYAMCVLALLAFGLALGCEGHTHREARIQERVAMSRQREVLHVDYFCKCGTRRPYSEIWR
jgi:hypothetical protein